MAVVAFLVFLGTRLTRQKDLTLQFAIAIRRSGSALQFRFFDPPDVDAAFAQAAAIAATWQIASQP